MKPTAKRPARVNSARRAFLASAATLPAGVLAAGALPAVPQPWRPVTNAAGDDSRTASRYRASEHVETYYRTAAF